MKADLHCFRHFGHGFNESSDLCCHTMTRGLATQTRQTQSCPITKNNHLNALSCNLPPLTVLKDAVCNKDLEDLLRIKINWNSLEMWREDTYPLLSNKPVLYILYKDQSSEAYDSFGRLYRLYGLNFPSVIVIFHNSSWSGKTLVMLHCR